MEVEQVAEYKISVHDIDEENLVNVSLNSQVNETDSDEEDGTKSHVFYQIDVKENFYSASPRTTADKVSPLTKGSLKEEALELSKSQVADLELKLSFQDANISKLAEESSLDSRSTTNQRNHEMERLLHTSKFDANGGAQTRRQELEQGPATESRNAGIESQLREVIETIANKEAEITNLKERLVSLETENAQLVRTNESLKGKVDAKVAMFDELNKRFSATRAENKEALEKLVVHEGTIAHLTEVHVRNLELHSADEPINEEIEFLFREALETIAQKEAEVKDMSKKLDALEIELGYYEEQTIEAAATEKNHKVKLYEALQQIKILEEQLAGTENKVKHFRTEKQNLVNANNSLNEELEVHQNKLNELQLALAEAIADKGSSEEIHSLRKTLEGMIQRKEELERQISCTLEESEKLNRKYQNMLDENRRFHEKYETAKKELGIAIAMLEEQINLEKLEELKYVEEIQTMQVETNEKDESVTTKIQEQHANLLHEKNELEQQLLEVRKELHAAYHTIANQVAEEREKLAFANTEHNKVTQNLNKCAAMEKVQDPEQKLLSYAGKLDEQAKNAVVSTQSREFSLDPSTRSNKQGDRSQAPGTSPNSTQQEMRGPSSIMSFKFILGVALLSVIIGVFLGKRF